MSYCRWSSDNFKSDVYVYERNDGLIYINVAANRIVSPLPPDPMDILLNGGSHEELAAASNAHREALDNCVREKIGLEYDGESFTCASVGDALNTLIMLKKKGYIIPQFAMDTLKEEMENEKDNATE